MNITYDEQFYAKAPFAPREARQGGYDIESERPYHDLPIPSRTTGVGVPPAGVGASFPPPAREMIPRLEEGQGAGKEYTSLGDRGKYDSKGDKKIPWYKTTKGIIILTVLALVVIGASVGGGVGGALSGKSNNKNNNGGKPSGGFTGQTSPASSGSPEMTTTSEHAPIGETTSTSPQVTIGPSSTQSARLGGERSR